VKSFLADLHIHTGLSPCAADEMTPRANVRAAVSNGLAMIAICDHNTAGNTLATQQAAGSRLTVLAGMEVTTAEEVHVLGIFPDAASAERAGQEVRATLPEADGLYQERFGDQQLMDKNGQVVGAECRMLAAASTFGLSDTVALIHRHDGIAIAAHVNRPSFSVISQLGLFPTEAGFDAIEVFSAPGFPSRTAELAGYDLSILASSDSHFLADIGCVRTKLEMHAPTFEELGLALRGIDGRRVCSA
jgi:3',5'-nucleoside bisphosphate phosphatase